VGGEGLEPPTLSV